MNHDFETNEEAGAELYEDLQESNGSFVVQRYTKFMSYNMALVLLS
jgi:hypothetical protein